MTLLTECRGPADQGTRWFVVAAGGVSGHFLAEESLGIGHLLV